MLKVFPLFARSIALRLKGRQNSWFLIEDFQAQGLDTLVLKNNFAIGSRGTTEACYIFLFI